MRSWSRAFRVVAWVGLGLLLPTPTARASHLREVPWEKLRGVKPGERLWVDLASGERQALRLVRADHQTLLALDLPGDWSDGPAREACRQLAMTPDLSTLVVGRGRERLSLEVAPARRRLARENVFAVTVVRPGSGRRGAALTLGAVTLVNMLLGLAAAHAD